MKLKLRTNKCTKFSYARAFSCFTRLKVNRRHLFFGDTSSGDLSGRLGEGLCTVFSTKHELPVELGLGASAFCFTIAVVGKEWAIILNLCVCAAVFVMCFCLFLRGTILCLQLVPFHT